MENGAIIATGDEHFLRIKGLLVKFIQETKE
jgi:hypothetical protein